MYIHVGSWQVYTSAGNAGIWFSADLFCVLPPLSEHGFVGYSADLLSSNTKPDYSLGENFFTVFGVFFPAATGK